MIVVGVATHDDGGIHAGSAYGFRSADDDVSWSEVQKLLVSDASALDFLGFSVAISGNLVVAGAFGDDDGGSRAGAAYLFRSVDNGTSWTEVEKLVASEAPAGDLFGWSVAISGNLVVVGATGDDDGADGAGSAYVFKTLS